MGDELPADLVVRFVKDAADEGYDYLAVSGGEPLAWRGLWSALRVGRASGMTVTMTTNATLVTKDLARAVADHVSYVAVSIEGSAKSHDWLRGSGVFARTQRGIETLQQAGVTIALIWTLTRSNVHELADVYSLATAIGAAFVQIHPLEGVGYAAQGLSAEVPDADELLVAGLFAAELRGQDYGSPAIYLDAASTVDMRGRVTPDDHDDAPLSSLVEPLILRADGWIVPGNYALPQPWAIGRLTEARLPELAQHWRREGVSGWRGLIEATLDRLPPDAALMNFGAQLLVTASRPHLYTRA
jgi:MoaA/NifB/PqqE/SkfB family radical SAM enzyme